jgi:hypothetical protein
MAGCMIACDRMRASKLSLANPWPKCRRRVPAARVMAAGSRG